MTDDAVPDREVRDDPPSRRPQGLAAEDVLSEDDPLIASLVEGPIRRTIETLVRVEARSIRMESFVGLPHPETLERYEAIYPGAARIIFEGFEKQSRHRQQLETYAIKSNVRRSNAGLAAGLIVTVSFLFASYSIVLAGYEVAGTILGTIDLAALVGVFIYGTQQQREERTEKAKIMTGQADGPPQPVEGGGYAE